MEFLKEYEKFYTIIYSYMCGCVCMCMYFLKFGWSLSPRDLEYINLFFLTVPLKKTIVPETFTE